MSGYPGVDVCERQCIRADRFFTMLLLVYQVYEHGV